MQETIGKIVLDETFYPGRDLYSDGSVEDVILDIVKNNPREEYRRIVEERANWPLFYHLSEARANIVSWLPVDKSKKVLEIGSGCGAITGALADRFGSVTGIDLSKKRSTINALRCAERDNVQIHVGNFMDIEKTLDCDYDCIFLIGVFEYGSGYIGGKTPFTDFLNIVKKHVSKDGHIFIAIENRLGLKYFSGCKEDHSGAYFDGIVNYPSFKGAKTFSKQGLEKMLKECGINEYSFYYPYPDYKFPNRIFSDEFLPSKGDLNDNIRNFDRDRLLLFDEAKAFDALCEDGLFPEFSNSFLIVTGPKYDIEYVKFSNENRGESKSIYTSIEKNGLGKCVYKRACSEKSHEHIDSVEESYRLLLEKYKGFPVEINKCFKRSDRKGELTFEFVKGKSLSNIMMEHIANNDREGFMKEFERFKKLASYNSEFPASDYDLIFENIIVDGDKWTLIDYEWTFREAVPASDIISRALYCFLLSNTGAETIKEWLLDEDFDFDATAAKEEEFQKKVCEGRMASSVMRHNIGNEVYTLDYVKDKADLGKKRIQVYEDHGKGFSENDSYFIERILQCGDEATFTVKLNQDLTNVRIDPSFSPCAVIFRSVTCEGKDVLSIVTGGKNNGKKKGRNVIVFPKYDPNFSFKVSKILGKRESAEIEFKLRIVKLDEETGAIFS